MEEYQAIIVGSGPAGAACAKALKEEDRHCRAVYEKKTFFGRQPD